MKRKIVTIGIGVVGMVMVACGPSDPRTEEQATTTKVAPGERATTNLGGDNYGDPDTTTRRAEEELLNHDPGRNEIGRNPRNMPQEVLTNDLDSVSNLQ
jgi:hypothetical protein